MIEDIDDPEVAKYLEEMPEKLRIPFTIFLQQKYADKSINNLKDWIQKCDVNNKVDGLMASIIDHFLTLTTIETSEKIAKGNCEPRDVITIAASCLINTAKDILSYIPPDDEINEQ